MTWQPIETAPLDGAKIDLWVEREGKVPLRIPNAYFYEGRWLHSFNGMRVWNEPTHWMPLPDPPAIADTHPKDGDVEQAPLVSGGGAGTAIAQKEQP